MGANAQTTVQKFLSGAVLTAEQQNFSAATGVPVFATTVTRDAAFGGANKVLAEGQLAYIEATDVVQYYDGAAWASVGAIAATTAYFREEQAAGTYGGTATSGSFVTRVLNTTVSNNIAGCSLAASEVTLPAGTYEILSASPAYTVFTHQSRIQNITDGTTIGYSTNAQTGTTAATASTIQYRFTIAATKVIALQMRVGVSVATDGLGSRTSWGNVEVYSQLTITKVA